jgi:hypothetical protein
MIAGCPGEVILFNFTWVIVLKKYAKAKGKEGKGWWAKTGWPKSHGRLRSIA